MTTPVQVTRSQAAQPAAVAKPAARGAKAGGGSSGRRIVRTPEGARRYGVPIGAEIGRARNDSAAKFQRNKPAQQRYKALVGRDRKAQAVALKGLNRTQLTRLTALAWSFKSKNPAVTQLRTALTKELYNRGINVRTYLAEVGVRGKSLGRGSAFRHSKDKQGRPMPGTVEAKAAAKPKPVRRVSKPKPGGRSRGSSGAAVPVRRLRPPLAPRKRRKPKKVASAMQARKNDRRLTQLSNVGQLRTVQAAFSEIGPDHRERAARWIVQQAVELSAVHMLSRTVVEASNVAPDSELGQQVIELAGRWKHGWVPLDGVAMRSKMKGGNGKPWWSGGKQKRRGNAQSLRRSIAAGNKHRRRTAQGDRDISFHAGESEPSKSVGRARLQARTGRMQKGQIDPGPGHRPKGDSVNRTTVVKSGDKPTNPGGAKMTTKSAKPSLPEHVVRSGHTLGSRVKSPEGTSVYKVEGSSVLRTHAVYNDEGALLGYLRKRSGYTRSGKSGAATTSKNTGFAVETTDGRSMGNQTTLTRAAEYLRDRNRKSGKA